MSNVAVFRLSDFKDYPEVLLIVVDAASALWLKQQLAGLGLPGTCAYSSFTIAKTPMSASNGIAVIAEVDMEINTSRLEEIDLGQFVWRMSRDSAVSFGDMIGGFARMTDAEGKNELKGSHYYFDPENSPPAPAIIVSCGEYDVERLLSMRQHRTSKVATDAEVSRMSDNTQGRMAPSREPLHEKLAALFERIDALPNLDIRSADEIIGYDEHGLPS